MFKQVHAIGTPLDVLDTILGALVFRKMPPHIQILCMLPYRSDAAFKMTWPATLYYVTIDKHILIQYQFSYHNDI